MTRPDRSGSARLRRSLTELGKVFYAKGWAVGTGGNFSVVEQRNPLRVAITASGVHKGEMSPDQIVCIDGNGSPAGKHSFKPSDESAPHLAIIKARNAGAVLHTHSIWATMVSERLASKKEIVIHGYEMLKGLEGVRTHLHRERVPILENTQDMKLLSERLASILSERPAAHGVLVRKHGLYTWGNDLSSARRHVEILEFLFEACERAKNPPMRRE